MPGVICDDIGTLGGFWDQNGELEVPIDDQADVSGTLPGTFETSFEPAPDPNVMPFGWRPSLGESVDVSGEGGREAAYPSNDVGESIGFTDHDAPADAELTASPGITPEPSHARRDLQCGQPEVIRSLKRVGERWALFQGEQAKDGKSVPNLEIWPISKEGGGPIGHKSHMTSLDVDIATVKDGEKYSPEWTKKALDYLLTIRMLTKIDG